MKSNMNDIIIKDCNSLILQLKERRISLGYTQREIAEKVCIPQSTLARLESGVLFPRIDTLIKIGTALGLKIIAIEEKK